MSEDYLYMVDVNGYTLVFRHSQLEHILNLSGSEFWIREHDKKLVNFLLEDYFQNHRVETRLDLWEEISIYISVVPDREFLEPIEIVFPNMGKTYMVKRPEEAIEIYNKHKWCLGGGLVIFQDLICSGKTRIEVDDSLGDMPGDRY